MSATAFRFLIRDYQQAHHWENDGGYTILSEFLTVAAHPEGALWLRLKELFNLETAPIKWNEVESIKIFSFSRTFLIAISTNENINRNNNYLNYLRPLIKMHEPDFLLYPVDGLEVKIEEFDEYLMSYHFYWTKSEAENSFAFRPTFFELHERHTSGEPGETWETSSSIDNGIVEESTGAKKQPKNS